jgi:uncharacterized protein (TIGR00299 family) protein
MNLYFACNSGISGDMTVAALLDLGADRQALLNGLASLGLEGYRIEITEAEKCAIKGTRFHVVLDDDPYLAHEHEEAATHSHEHTHEHEHVHDHVHPHTHRGMPEIRAIIERSAISSRAKQMALDVFQNLAAAEGKAHGLPPEEVHFHEVGAVDSIVDIVGAAICLDNLQAETIYFSPLCEGSGTVWCQHGRLPVPVPAVTNLAAEHHIPLKLTNVEGEMVTPTGAAFAATFGTFVLPGQMCFTQCGIGVGQKDFPHANILRVFALAEQAESDEVLLLQANIDDQTGESLGYAMEKLLAAGALDCWFTPIYMKKNRPAITLSVLCQERDQKRLVDLMMIHTNTIGVRYSRWDRSICHRTVMTVTTPLGDASVKKISWNGHSRYTAEYESAKTLADMHNIPLQQAMEIILDAIKKAD